MSLRSTILRIQLGTVGFAIACVVWAGCGDSDSRPPAADSTGVPGGPPPTGAGSSGASGAPGLDAGGEDEGGDGGSCNDLPNTGLLVDRIGVIGEPPVGLGGTIVDGIYDLNTYSVYVGLGGVGGPTGITVKASMRIAGSKLDDVFEFSGSGPAQTIRTSNAFTIASATLARTELCPASGGGGQVQFTASGSTLILTNTITKEAFTFLKR